MSQKYSGRVAVIVTVFLLALLAIFAPSVAHPSRFFDPSLSFIEKTALKPGIDIVGGTSLLYQIKKPEGGGDWSNLAEQVMQALKKRVDPNGTMNLIWRPQGNDRLEIQMPASSATNTAGKARAAVADARKALEATNINVADAVDALQGQNGKKRDDFDKLTAVSPAARKQVLTDLAKAHDDMQKAQAAGDVPAGAAAEKTFNQLQESLAGTNLSPASVDQALSNRDHREQRATDLKKTWGAYPERVAAIDAYKKATDALSAGSGLESAADLKRLLQGSGVLEYHILAHPSYSNPTIISAAEYQDMLRRVEPTGPGPRLQAGDKYRWFEVENPTKFGHPTVAYNDRHYVLASVKPEDSLDRNTGKWALKRAYPGRDQNGQGIVEFEFDASGGAAFGNLTSSHLHQPMAIMLDDRVVSAPTIQSPITGGKGQISGSGPGGFGKTESDYLVRMLSAGSLPAQLDQEPISERTVGPQLGEDNLRAGLLSCGLGLVVIAVFLFTYYRLSGVIAFVGLILNIVLILGCMAAINATFTLPGIAAIVLTIGTSVDANVLVYERLREEQHRGLPLRMALRNAYDRAFSAIVDSNMTTLITSFFLIVFGTEEVKGFGIVLIIGILASLFTALFVTRTIFGILIDKGHIKTLTSLPLLYPRWERMLHPKLNWMKLAPYFYGFSAVVIVAGLWAFVHYARAGQILDIEFASGTAVTFELKPRDPAYKQEEVRDWVNEASRQHPDVLPAPGVVRVEEGAGGAGTTWEVTTPNANSRAVRDLVIATLGDSGRKVLKAEQPAKFVGIDAKPDDVTEAAGLVLGLSPANLDAAQSAAKWPAGFSPPVPTEAQKYKGGVAIFLKNLDPPLTPKQIKDRIDRQVLQAQAGQQGGARTVPAAHDFTVIGAAGPEQPASTAIVLAYDELLPYDTAEADAGKNAKWAEGVARPMWALVGDAVSRPPDLKQVKTFDKSVAGDTQRDAFVALLASVLVIMAYIWIRFGNLKYGAATVVALLHDVVFTVAALGLAHLLAGNWFGDALQLEPFRINLTVVAGILTVMGYSMVDTIVVFDRIREIRGKFGHVSGSVINDAINQTLSRTLLTAGTTLVMVAIMYFVGGTGIHGFTFVLLVGILVGSYSSVAIASPILLVGGEPAAEPAGRGRAVGSSSRLQRAGT